MSESGCPGFEDLQDFYWWIICEDLKIIKSSYSNSQELIADNLTDNLSIIPKSVYFIDNQTTTPCTSSNPGYPDSDKKYYNIINIFIIDYVII